MTPKVAKVKKTSKTGQSKKYNGKGAPMNTRLFPQPASVAPMDAGYVYMNYATQFEKYGMAFPAGSRPK